MTDPRVQQLIDWVQARQPEGGAVIGPHTDLFASGALDSMGLVSLFFMIETMGGRAVDPAEVVAAGPITAETIVHNWW